MTPQRGETEHEPCRASLIPGFHTALPQANFARGGAVSSRDMVARVQSYLLEGIDAAPCEVEVDADEQAENKVFVVGLPDAGIK